MPPKEFEKDEELQEYYHALEEFIETPHNRKERRHYVGYEGAEYKQKKKYF